jgi:hypothetical protein
MSCLTSFDMHIEEKKIHYAVKYVLLLIDILPLICPLSDKFNICDTHIAFEMQ